MQLKNSRSLIFTIICRSKTLLKTVNLPTLPNYGSSATRTNTGQCVFAAYRNNSLPAMPPTAKNSTPGRQHCPNLSATRFMRGASLSSNGFSTSKNLLRRKLPTKYGKLPKPCSPEMIFPPKVCSNALMWFIQHHAVL